MLMLAAGLFAIGLLVLVHELGHFLVARVFGIGAPVFSIGMGPRIAGFRWGDTDVRISALPIGGYVQLAGADPFGEEDADSGVPPEQDFSKRPVWQKLLVMAAGPGVNLILPVFLFTGLLMAGRPELAAEVGTIVPDSVAADAGLARGDRITAVGEDTTPAWVDVSAGLATHLGSDGPVGIDWVRGDAQGHGAVPASALAPGLMRGVDAYTFGALPFHWAARIGVPDPASPAAQAGLQTGDEVVAVDGEAVEHWDGIHDGLAGPGEHVLTVERPDPGAPSSTTQHTIVLPPAPAEGFPQVAAFDDPWGMVPIATFIASVSEGHPAEAAGLRTGDRFLTIDGAPVWSFDHFNARVERLHEGRTGAVPLTLTVQRGADIQTVEVTPEMIVVPGEPWKRPIIGVRSWGGVARSVGLTSRAYPITEAVPVALEETGLLMHATLSLLGNLLVMEADVSESVGGPVAIVQVAGETAERGLFAFIGMLGMLSISLGLVNLLPVPVLDGGQILFHLIEAVRGRPLSIELREKVQMVGVMLLAVTFLYVTANDLSRLWGA